MYLCEHSTANCCEYCNVMLLLSSIMFSMSSYCGVLVPHVIFLSDAVTDDVLEDIKGMYVGCLLFSFNIVLLALAQNTELGILA